ncbi:MAG TPA: type II toxin-antitoxin system VapC family toxin [Acidimicrobiia bacterium]
MIVVDASVLAPVVLDDGPDGTRMRARLRGERVAAPDLAKVEAASVIRRHLASGAVDYQRASQAIENLIDFPILIFPTAPFLRRAWELRDNVTAYDACYVALAETLACAMLTADGRLARAPGLECAVELV